jgi:predicted dehydrogenase
VQVDVQIHYAAKLRDTTVQDPPSSLDWDFWCGPAPKLLYSPNIGHFAWRLEAAYGNGHLVDWGIHWIDAVRRILGEKTPRTVQAMGGLYYLKDRITTPDTLTVHFDFPTCPVTWRHRIWGATEYNPEVSNGMFFYGERETVFVADDRWIVIPREKEGDRRVDAVKTPDMATLHMADFLQAVRTRRSPLCDVEDGFHSTATVQLGMIAYHAGCRIEWDAAAESIPGNPAATRLLKREYRAPWKHPADELTT